MGYFSNFSHLVLYDPRLHASMNVHSADKLFKESSDSNTDSRTKDQKEKALADAAGLLGMGVGMITAVALARKKERKH